MSQSALWVLPVLALAAAQQQQQATSGSYGVDCSMPMRSVNFDDGNTCGDLLGDRTGLYREFMETCRDRFDWRCDQTESQRTEQLRRQPQSLVNYTSRGYDKIKAPPAMMMLVQDHWNRNNRFGDDTEDPVRVEHWPKGNTYVNWWQKNTTMYAMNNPACGGGTDLQDKMFALAKPILEEWTGMELQPTSLYGIRVYREGAILMPHVDRNPLISSAIINVAQDPDMTEDWPLEVYGRDGQAVNITMVPGDMVLYESHTLIHGRPFPLQGKYYANVFIHFEPTGRLLKDIDNDDMEYGTPGNPAGYEAGVKLPPYILPGSPEATMFVRMNPWGWGETEPDDDDDAWWESDSEDWEDDSGDRYSEDDEEEEWEEEDAQPVKKDIDDGSEDDEPAAELDSINNNPSCPSDMDPSMAPVECRNKLAEEEQRQNVAIA